ncbi:MAG: hypothetical protein H6737_06665 [Alphaproteobacteria bacterium]|nr:hypothetical protein [Alphaproteobacteria bacterium]
MMWTVLTLLACSGGEAPKPDVEPVMEQAADPVKAAAEIANAIDADPATAEDVLKKHGMTEDAYRALLYDIAEDPAKSAQFLEARGG